ncbi:hypothetical protein TNCV_810161 [Trichonephila clavipes]|uniref:Uncharacterized protein n=1 Tax=Trichonephila clavipes TaxID=2585209 RepID=A0A8X6SKC8_TRICX|nr:hypothetical protein TNCV_810161 [Trichonephila clavipes]
MKPSEFLPRNFVHFDQRCILISLENKIKKLRRGDKESVWTVNSPQSHIVRVYDAGHGKSGVFHSAEWHEGDWSSDGIREAWLWFFIWVESF